MTVRDELHVGDLPATRRQRGGGYWDGIVERVRRTDPFVSTEYIWRCKHPHRSPSAARECAAARIVGGDFPEGSR